MEGRMAVKTITIDMEAYELLSAEKQGNESFSKVIKRTLSSRKRTASALLAGIDSFLLEEDTLERVDEIVRSRGDSVLSSPVLDPR